MTDGAGRGWGKRRVIGEGAWPDAAAQMGASGLPFSANGRPLAAGLRTGPPPASKRQKLNPADAPNPVVFVATKDTRSGGGGGGWGGGMELGGEICGFEGGLWGLGEGVQRQGKVYVALGGGTGLGGGRRGPGMGAYGALGRGYGAGGGGDMGL